MHCRAKRRKENREKAKRFRSKAKANSFQLIEDEDITEGLRQGECSQGQKEKLVVKIDFKRPTKAARNRKRIIRGIATAHNEIRNFTSILAIIAAPTPHGKTKRQYKVNTETVGMISHNMAGEEYLKRV